MIIKTQEIQQWVQELKFLLDGIQGDAMPRDAQTCTLHGLINSMDEEIKTAHKEAIKSLVEKHGTEVGLDLNEIKITTTA